MQSSSLFNCFFFIGNIRKVQVTNEVNDVWSHRYAYWRCSAADAALACCCSCTSSSLVKSLRTVIYWHQL